MQLKIILPILPTHNLNKIRHIRSDCGCIWRRGAKMTQLSCEDSGPGGRTEGNGHMR